MPCGCALKATAPCPWGGRLSPCSSLEKCDCDPVGLLFCAGLELCGCACDHVALAPQCIDSEARAANYTSSLNLPDKTLQFVKDHPLMDDSVTPIDNRPRLIKKDVNYTQIAVDRVQALDGTFYDVMFISTGGCPGKTNDLLSRLWVDLASPGAREVCENLRGVLSCHCTPESL